MVCFALIMTSKREKEGSRRVQINQSTLKNYQLKIRELKPNPSLYHAFWVRGKDFTIQNVRLTGFVYMNIMYNSLYNNYMSDV